VDGKEEYEIEDCQPELDGGWVDALLAEVNKTNNFGEFVENIRRAFVDNVGFQATRSRGLLRRQQLAGRVNQPGLNASKFQEQ